MYQGVTPTPDRAFMKDLKQFDSRLDVVFDRMAERFIIRRDRGFGKPWGVLLVETEDGQFRQPDQRDIKRLYAGDLWRHGGVDARVRRGEQYTEDYNNKVTKDAEDDIRALSRENKIQLSNVYRKASNQGSKAPEFRRIEDIRKPGAKTLKEIKAARAAGRDPWTKAA